MNREELLEQVKRAVRGIEPDVEIILYGSRARRDWQDEVGWALAHR